MNFRWIDLIDPLGSARARIHGCTLMWRWLAGELR
jgi:hypothetical protein